MHRKRAWVKGRSYPFPINLETINAFFDEQLTEDNVATFLRAKAAPFYTDRPANFEDAALASVGQELYEGFFRGYTNKQWGRPPRTSRRRSFAGYPFISKKIPTFFSTSGRDSRATATPNSSRKSSTTRISTLKSAATFQKTFSPMTTNICSTQVRWMSITTTV